VIGYVSPRHKVFLLWSEETTLAGWPRSPGGPALGGPAPSQLLTAQGLRLSPLDRRWRLTLFVAPRLAKIHKIGPHSSELARAIFARRGRPGQRAIYGLANSVNGQKDLPHLPVNILDPPPGGLVRL